MSDTRAASLPDQIRECLQDLLPEHIEIEDQSAAHAGHAGARAGAHFRLLMVSAAFSGQTRLQRHRMVNERLQHLLQGRIHALTMSLLAPEEKR